MIKIDPGQRQYIAMSGHSLNIIWIKKIAPGQRKLIALSGQSFNIYSNMKYRSRTT